MALLGVKGLTVLYVYTHLSRVNQEVIENAANQNTGTQLTRRYERQVCIPIK